MADVDGDPRRHAVGQLLRPIHPLFAYAAEHLSAIPLRIIVVSPIVACCCSRRRGTGWRVHDPALLPILAASLVGAWLLTFFSMVLLGSLAFYVDSAMGVFELWIGVHAIFSGYLVPLELLPGWVRVAADVLPFRFMLGVPGRDAGRAADARGGAAPARGAVAVRLATGIAARAAWRAGVRRFAAFGG